MTDRSTWKKLESRIAHKFGTERTPLSGGNSRITQSDTLSSRYFIEIKLRATLPFWKEFLDAKQKAKKEGKRPLLAFHKKGYKGVIIMLDLDDFLEIEEGDGDALYDKA